MCSELQCWNIDKVLRCEEFLIILSFKNFLFIWYSNISNQKKLHNSSFSFKKSDSDSLVFMICLRCKGHRPTERPNDRTNKVFHFGWRPERPFAVVGVRSHALHLAPWEQIIFSFFLLKLHDKRERKKITFYFIS
jgi:hypothetical protein